MLLSYLWVRARGGSGVRHLQAFASNKSTVRSLRSLRSIFPFDGCSGQVKVEYEIVPQLNNKKPDDVLNSLDAIEESKAGIPCACANVKWLN